jgi:hypothetical protein
MNKIILIITITISPILVCLAAFLVTIFTTPTQSELAAQDKRWAEALLPSNAIVIEDLGNRWYIVEIKKKEFLFGYWRGSHSEKGFTITELKSED